MSGQSSKFSRIRTVNAELSRVQDNVGAVLDPLAQAVQVTPIMGAAAPPWIRFTIAAGWATIAGQAIPAFHKDALGYVHIKCALQNTSGGPTTALMFTLPRGYRPAELNDIPASVSGGPAQAVIINPDGTVKPDSAVGNNAHIHVTITFLAEQ